jgi:hypothetical protein
VWVSWTFDVAMSNILSFFVHFMGRFDEIGAFVGILNLVLKN